jgi:dihydroorotase
MRLKEIQSLELPPTADMHVHLRQAEMMELVTPQIRKGGVDAVFVMVHKLYTSLFIS